MEKKLHYTTSGVCASAIDIVVENDIIKKANFDGGCQGNQSGICALVKGMKTSEAIARLSGIRCGRKASSCPDQLAHALQEIEAE